MIGAASAARLFYLYRGLSPSATLGYARIILSRIRSSCPSQPSAPITGSFPPAAHQSAARSESSWHRHPLHAGWSTFPSYCKAKLHSPSLAHISSPSVILFRY